MLKKYLVQSPICSLAICIVRLPVLLVGRRVEQVARVQRDVDA